MEIYIFDNIIEKMEACCKKCFTYQELEEAVYFGYFMYSFIWYASYTIWHLQISYKCIRIRSLDTNYESSIT